MLVLDQGGQLKSIIGATILDYNRTTVFGLLTAGNKRTWLGKYKTPEQAERVQRQVNRALSLSHKENQIYEIPK